MTLTVSGVGAVGGMGVVEGNGTVGGVGGGWCLRVFQYTMCPSLK